jgi:hypothetical protein
MPQWVRPLGLVKQRIQGRLVDNYDPYRPQWDYERTTGTRYRWLVDLSSVGEADQVMLGREFVVPERNR